ncbi:toprim domain-containing protein [Cryptosporangium phraense]|uniref:Toprim domain-containing protein n=1 Tax=Cryptosporangium phraense TaxID=2593070 RepID=A0A545ASR2_9ACTN|nr:toprim domain-containing protein [Cryptosporangium phraense]TQS44358.1 hypothetical protein FL583_15610 [Cryptosporangium phraense]
MSRREADTLRDIVLPRLENVRQSGSGYMAQCPVHGDAKASLSVDTGHTQPVLLHCFAGCDRKDILAALGLADEDISKPRDHQVGLGRDGWMPNGLRASAIYTYTDETGTHLFDVVRSTTKEFLQRRPDQAKKSGWSWNIQGVRRVLYRLPEVIAAVDAGATVWIAEGEKDVEALRQAGVTATCNSGGAGKWRDDYGRFLRGAVVRIVADNDYPGRKHALGVTASLRKLGCDVTVLTAATGKDAHDHLAAGHGLDDFVQLAEEAPESEDPPAEASTHARTSQVADLVPADAVADELRAFIVELREWLDLPDPTGPILTLATAATTRAQGEPSWLLLVAPPSSGKTESVRLLDGVTDSFLDDVTAAGLLGWSKGKNSRPTGVLARVGATALVTFGDLSSLLATSDRGGRDQVFGILRRAYDGHVTRDISPPGMSATDEPLEWRGRLTVVAAVTGAIDRYSSHSDQLGPRWVYYRLPVRDTAAKRRAAAKARRKGPRLDAARKAAGEKAAALVRKAMRRIVEVEISDALDDAITDAALVTCWGRAVVPRHGYGRREIDGVPTIEDPPRVVQQLRGIASGLLALGLPESMVMALTRRVALDSMPITRQSVLRALAGGEVMTTAELARQAHLDRKVARFAAEELQLIGVVEGERDGEEPDDDSEIDMRPVFWSLSGDDGDLVAEVFQESYSSVEVWDEMWELTPHPPQKIKKGGVATNISSHGQPAETDVPAFAAPSVVTVEASADGIFWPDENALEEEIELAAPDDDSDQPTHLRSVS